MKIQQTKTILYQTVTAYDEKSVEINRQRFTNSFIVTPEQAPTLWPVTSLKALTPAHFKQIETLQPDILIIGTGRQQGFISLALAALLTGQGIGVECMNNQAACRTYNLLMAEGRRVALAIIIELEIVNAMY